MSVEIKRDVSQHFSVTCSSAAGTTSGRFPYGPFSGGIIYIGDTAGCTQINWQAALTQGQSPEQVYSNANAVTSSATVGFHPVPDALFGAQFVVPVATGATTGMVIQVGLKG